MHCIAYRMPFELSYRTCIRAYFAYAAIAHPMTSGGNDVDRNDRAYDKAYDKEDCLGKNHEKQLRNMSD